MDGKLQTKTPAEFFAENRNIAGFDNVRPRRAAARRLAAPRKNAASRIRALLRPAGAPRGRARRASGSVARGVLRSAAAAV